MFVKHAVYKKKFCMKIGLIKDPLICYKYDKFEFWNEQYFHGSIRFYL